MKRGDFVRVTYNGQTVRAMVMLVSENGASVALGFDGLLLTPDGAAIGGFMPVLRDSDGVFRDILVGEPAQITPEGAAA